MGTSSCTTPSMFSLSCGTRTSRSTSKTTHVCRPSTTCCRGFSMPSQRTACQALREGWSPRSWPCPSLILAVVCVRGAAFSARRSHQCREHPSSWTPGRVGPNENQTLGQRTWAGGQPWDKQPGCCGCGCCWCGCCGCCFVILLFLLFCCLVACARARLRLVLLLLLLLLFPLPFRGREALTHQADKGKSRQGGRQENTRKTLKLNTAPQG